MIEVHSDEKKAWIPTKHSPFIMTIFQNLPGQRKFVKGIPYFEMSRANLEAVDLACPTAKWSGPAKQKLEDFRALRRSEQLTRTSLLESPPEITDFEFKVKPYDHQLKAFALSRGKTFYGYFMEQGTGKSKVILDVAGDLFLNGGENGRIDTLVVIAPNGVHRQWVLEQIPTHLTDQISYRAAYTTANPTPEEARRMSEMLKFTGGLRILAVHVEFLSTEKGKRYLADFLRGCRALGVLDESTRFKEQKSNRTKTVLHLAPLFAYRRIATGTPVTQGVQDLFTQLAFLSEDILGYSSFYSFRNHFCRMGGFGNKKIVGSKNEEELIQKLDSHCFRVLKEDCLDLPPKVPIRREVPLHPEQKKVYDQMKKKFFLELESGEIMTVKMAMTRMTRLQQIINGFIWRRVQKKDGRVITTEEYQEFPSNRADVCVEILQESADDQKFIIWVKFEGDHRVLSQALDKAGISWTDYVGTLDNNTAEANLQKFKDDPSIKVLISSPKKGGTGLNLTVASNVIWFSRDFSLEMELQANDRVHRIGQKNTVIYYYLVSPGTIDEKVEQIQNTKLSVATSIVDFREFV